MDISVIVTTYNAPAWLEKALWGWQAQDEPDFQLVIADDGSGDETREVVDRLRATCPFAITHLWHEDRGFRKCAILNRAIRAATGDYLVFSDGDCVPRRDFVRVHRALARPGRFLSGGYIKLPAAASHELALPDVLAGRHGDVNWLWSRGARRPGKLLLTWPLGGAGVLLDQMTPTRATFNGHNVSAFRSDILAVNGFDERMQWGGLDRELGERLENAAIRGLQIRHRTVCAHLDHARPWVNQKAFARNQAIRAETCSLGLTWTEFGVVQGPRELRPEEERELLYPV